MTLNLCFLSLSFITKDDCFSVLVNSEDPDLMKHGKLGKNNQNHCREVDAEMKGIILCIKTSQHKHNDRKDGQELSSCSKLCSIINLFPMSQISNNSLISSLPWSSFNQM